MDPAATAVGPATVTVGAAAVPLWQEVHTLLGVRPEYPARPDASAITLEEIEQETIVNRKNNAEFKRL